MAPVFLNKKGFTLIEFMVAILIMTVGLFGLLSAMNVALSKDKQTQLRNEAISVLDKQMAQELSKGFNNISTTYMVTTRTSHVMNANVNYTLTRNPLNIGQTISSLNNAPTSKIVTYQVSWYWNNVPQPPYSATSVSSQPNL
jgi:type IV pilus assembly protein PilV